MASASNHFLTVCALTGYPEKCWLNVRAICVGLPIAAKSTGVELFSLVAMGLQEEIVMREEKIDSGTKHSLDKTSAP